MLIPVWGKEIPYFDREKRQFPPTLSPFLLEGENNPCCIVIPGGGYAKKSWDSEGVRIAEWLNSIGISALVLDYRIGPEYDGKPFAPFGKTQKNWGLIPTASASADFPPADIWQAAAPPCTKRRRTARISPFFATAF